MLIEALGGLGLFLLGMIVMTDGLRSLAGDAIRRTLIRFTRSPLSGAACGALCTAILQSSSATTVAAVGFVAAGLMGFPAALGIIFGANIGTTITGWMVVLLGFKFKLGLIAMPLVFFGAALRLFAAPRLGAIGFAIAGFGLIFVGVTTMQEAMFEYRGLVSFERLPGDSFGGRVLLVGIGVVFTIIAQSSSAGVAATLTAVYAGVINFEQAAALVIGMDVGTSVTALMAALGGSVSARRTGLSHVIYNVMTGVAALLLVSPYIALWETIAPGALKSNAEIGIVAFHTGFNAIGVTVALLFVRPFAHMMERLVRGYSPDYTGSLDLALIDHPDLALNALHGSVKVEFMALLEQVDTALGGTKSDNAAALAELRTALDETHAYLDSVHASEGQAGHWSRLVATIHALDHMQRLHERCEERTGFQNIADDAGITAEREILLAAITVVAEHVAEGRWIEAARVARRAADEIDAHKDGYRVAVVERIGGGGIDVPTGTQMLEVTRWLQRVSHHVARVAEHISEAVVASGADDDLA